MNPALRLSALLLAFACLSSANAADPPAAPQEPQKCALKQYTSLDLRVTPGGVLMVPVTLDGKASLMWLNLASAASVIWKPAADELHLRRIHLPIGAQVRLGGQTVVESGAFHSLIVGTVNFGKGEFLVAPEPVAGLTTEGPYASVGFIGAEMLSLVDFELDLAHRKMNLFSQERCPGMSPVYWASNYARVPLFQGQLGELYFPIELEGKKVEATLSPSDAFTTLSTDVTQLLYGFDENSPGVEVERGDTPDEVSHHFRAMQLTASGLTVKNSRITLTARDKNCRLATRGRKGGGTGYNDSCIGVYPMKLGRNVLEQLRLYFATKEKMLYFTAADATKQ